MENTRKKATIIGLDHDENYYFDQARKSIKNIFGLELTIIELMNLRQTIRECTPSDEEFEIVKKLIMEGKSSGGYNIAGEAITRFMMDYYGLPFGVSFTHTTGRYVETDIPYKNRKEFFQYLKILQERAHLP
jgi:hypothetical protein